MTTYFSLIPFFKRAPTELNYTLAAQDEVDEQYPPDEDDIDTDAEFGGHAARKSLEKKLLRKLDLRMSLLVLIYILNFIDRNNAAAARLRGFEEDLHLKGRQFDNLLGGFHIGYILMQIPSNMYLNHMGKPSIYLSSCMIVWGCLSILTGFAHGFTEAFLTRFFLGIVESTFFPGAIFLLSKWYKRTEVGLRTAILFSGMLISNAFGAVLASAILDGMEGKSGRAAWRWLFYIEGSMTIVVAIIAIFLLPDFPATSSFLSPLEQRLALKRLEEDAGTGDSDETEPKNGRFAGLTMALGDVKVWWLALADASFSTSLSYQAFFPTLVATLGYGRTTTLLLCAPPWIVSTAIAFCVSRHSDSVGERFNHITIPLAVSLVGFIISIITVNNLARYVAFFLMTQSYVGFICFLTWVSNSISRPPSKRAVALALVNALGQLGNVAGSYIWPKRWGPSYSYSYTICIAANLLAIAMSALFRTYLRRVNQKEEEQEMRKGRAPGYRYIL